MLDLNINFTPSRFITRSAPGIVTVDDLKGSRFTFGQCSSEPTGVGCLLLAGTGRFEPRHQVRRAGRGGWGELDAVAVSSVPGRDGVGMAVPIGDRVVPGIKSRRELIGASTEPEGLVCSSQGVLEEVAG